MSEVKVGPYIIKTNHSGKAVVVDEDGKSHLVSQEDFKRLLAWLIRGAHWLQRSSDGTSDDCIP